MTARSSLRGLDVRGIDHFIGHPMLQLNVSQQWIDLRPAVCRWNDRNQFHQRLAFGSVGFQVGSQHLSVGAQLGSDAGLHSNSEK
jgi:hypothetical protein